MLFGIRKDKRKNETAEGGTSPSREEVLTEEKNDMIQGVEELSDTAVKEVMVPRIDIDALPLDTPRDELLKRVAAGEHSRIPVYNESIDNIVGVLYVKDLIRALAEQRPLDLETIIRKPYFVPETKKIDSLLGEFKKRKIHIAVVIDEYGGVSGIVCMEDIIEEIVGDIQDEFDNEREDIITLSENAWICDARITLDDLNEAINANFPKDDFDTLGGFVFDLFGKIPVKFEKISWSGYDIIIQEMDGHKIDTIKIIRTAPDSGDNKTKPSE